MNAGEIVFFGFLLIFLLMLINQYKSDVRIEALEKDNARFMGIVAQNPRLFLEADLPGGESEK